MIQESDIDNLFGKRRCGPVPTRSARQDQDRVHKAAEVFFKTLIAVMPKTPLSGTIIDDLTVGTLAAIALIPPHDRVGIPDGQSDLGDMEGVIRLFTKFPEQFDGMDGWIGDMKKVALDMRKTGKLNYEPKA